jgi:hypothetical protein
MRIGSKPRLSLRVRLSAALAAATLPFAFVFLFADLWVYQPLQVELRALSSDIEHRWESVGRLQLALTRSAMPVNDYLIHGRVEERGQFQRLAAQVEAAFATLSANTPFVHKTERELLDTLRERWRLVRQRGEQVLQLDTPARYSIRTADTMENFDAELDLIVDASDELLEHVRAELQQARAKTELRGARLNWFVTLAAAMATLITLSMVVYLNHTLQAPYARRAGDELPEDNEAPLTPPAEPSPRRAAATD